MCSEGILHQDTVGDRNCINQTGLQIYEAHLTPALYELHFIDQNWMPLNRTGIVLIRAGIRTNMHQ